MQVGDNVGDCAARGADLFESIAAEIISAMILGGTMAQRCKIEGKFPFYVDGRMLTISTYFSLFTVSWTANSGGGI